MNEFYRNIAERLRTDFASAMLLTYIYIYIYIYLDIVPDVPDTSGESKNNIGPPSGGPKIGCYSNTLRGVGINVYHLHP